MPSKEWTIFCPDCGERIRVDRKTGAIIAHGSGDKPGSFDEAAKQRELRQSKKEDAFIDAMEAEKARSEELNQLFRKASEEIGDSDQERDGRPENPMDDQWR